MDSKYYALVEIIAFAALALGFCGYQIWTVRRKSDDPKQMTDDASDAAHKK